MSRLAGRVAIVSGGASSIGGGIARRFAREGAQVALLDLPNAVAGAIAGVELIATDLRAKAAIVSSIDSVVARYGRTDILVNAAADDSQPQAMEARSDDEFATQFGKCFEATRWAMRAAFPHMRAQGSGHIINVVSVYGVSVWRGLDAYQAASEAIKALTRTAAEEWGQYGILVNALLPAADTDAYRRDRNKAAEEADRIVQNSPLGRLGDAERDIGGAAMLLVTDSGRFLTGHLIHVDGGQHLTPSPYEALLQLGS